LIVERLFYKHSFVWKVGFKIMWREVRAMLADKQKSLLKFLGGYQAAHGFLPSVREVMAFLGKRSTNTAQYHLNRLETEGYLQRERGRARAFRLTERAREVLGSLGRRLSAASSRAADTIASVGRSTIPLLGRITAGSLDLAVEDARGALDLAEFVRADDATFALRVEGDSMTGAGIFDGDLVIVRRQPRLRDGEIGVVLVDGETTVKYVRYEGDEIILRPANERYREIRIPRSHPALEICGRVIGVVRRI
jgi:repressor LexA